MINIKIKKMSETAKLPTRGSAKAAGWDLYADITEPIAVEPHTTAKIFTGLAMEIPEGYFGAVYARSGLATNKGLRPPNCVGVIDSDYRGNIGIALHNDSSETQVIEPQERVAQIVISPYLPVEFEETDELSKTERGDRGFGSTGRK